LLQQKFHIYIRRIVRDPILSVGQQKNWREAIKWSIAL